MLVTYIVNINGRNLFHCLETFITFSQTSSIRYAYPKLGKMYSYKSVKIHNNKTMVIIPEAPAINSRKSSVRIIVKYTHYTVKKS